MTVVVAHPSECQMSKRKPATAQKRARSPKNVAQKRARSPKNAAKAQRAKQAIVRSPKDSRLLAAGSTESLLQRHSDSKQEGSLVENSAIAFPDDCKQTKAWDGQVAR